MWESENLYKLDVILKAKEVDFASILERIHHSLLKFFLQFLMNILLFCMISCMDSKACAFMIGLQKLSVRQWEKPMSDEANNFLSVGTLLDYYQSFVDKWGLSGLALRSKPSEADEKILENSSESQLEIEKRI